MSVSQQPFRHNYTLDANGVPLQPLAGVSGLGGRISHVARQDGSLQALSNPAIPGDGLARWRAALARVRAGTGRGRLLCVGDSTTAGFGSAGAGMTNAVASAYPTRLSQILQNSYGIPTSFKSMIGTNVGTSGVTVPAADPRIAFTNITVTGNQTLGGTLMRIDAGGTLSFTPAGTFDTFLVLTAANGLGSQFTVNVNGGAAIGGTLSIGASTVRGPFTTTRGTGTINMVHVSGTSLFCAGIIAWDSTVPAIDVMQAGYSGGFVTDFRSTANPWSPGNMYQHVAPDLTIVMLTINDASGDTGIDLYASRLTEIVTAAKVTGDVIVASGVPNSFVSTLDGTHSRYIARAQRVARDNGCQFVDIFERWGSHAVSSAAPISLYSDALHPNATGYADIAAAFAQRLAV